MDARITELDLVGDSVWLTPVGGWKKKMLWENHGLVEAALAGGRNVLES